MLYASWKQPSLDHGIDAAGDWQPAIFREEPNSSLNHLVLRDQAGE
jgi:hypothetical protein